MSLSMLASSRLASFAFSNSSLHLSARCLGATVIGSPFHNRPSMRFMSTPQYQSVLGTKDTRHAELTRDIIKDAVDQQLQNRPALSTPEQRWLDRSKRALESVARTPPADTYSGKSFFLRIVLLCV
jgi:hypothetical protein